LGQFRKLRTAASVAWERRTAPQRIAPVNDCRHNHAVRTFHSLVRLSTFTFPGVSPTPGDFLHYSKALHSMQNSKLPEVGGAMYFRKRLSRWWYGLPPTITKTKEGGLILTYPDLDHPPARDRLMAVLRSRRLGEWSRLSERSRLP
jgi:hypothetical protein